MIYTAASNDYRIKRYDIPCFGEDAIFQRPIMEAKRYKILPHLFFKDPTTIWTDSNIKLKTNFENAVSKWLKDSDICMFKHPYRKSVWEEFNTLRLLDGLEPLTSRFNIPWLQSKLSQQQKFYEDDGLPKDTPLWECNFIIRRNNEQVNRLMDAWWAQICRWQWRDQVSFPYVAWKYGQNVKIKTIDEGNIRNHASFNYTYH